MYLLEKNTLKIVALALYFLKAPLIEDKTFQQGSWIVSSSPVFQLVVFLINFVSYVGTWFGSPLIIASTNKFCVAINVSPPQPPGSGHRRRHKQAGLPLEV